MRIHPGMAFQLHELEQCMNTLPDFVFARAIFTRADRQTECHIFKDVHVPKQRIMLKDKSHTTLPDGLGADVVVMEQNRPTARVGLLQPGNNSEQGCLAAAGRPQQGHQLAVTNRQADIFQRGKRTECLTDIGYLNTHRMPPITALA